MQVWHKYKTLMSKKTSLTTKTTPKQSIETRMTNQRKPRCEWTPTWRWLRSTNLRVTTHRPPARAAITFWFDFFRHCQVLWYITSFADILAERNHLFAHTFFFPVNMSYYMGHPDEWDLQCYLCQKSKNQKITTLLTNYQQITNKLPKIWKHLGSHSSFSMTLPPSSLIIWIKTSFCSRTWERENYEKELIWRWRW